jgi:hypothetical protein
MRGVYIKERHAPSSVARSRDPLADDDGVFVDDEAG